MYMHVRGLIGVYYGKYAFTARARPGKPERCQPGQRERCPQGQPGQPDQPGQPCHPCQLGQPGQASQTRRGGVREIKKRRRGIKRITPIIKLTIKLELVEHPQKN